MLAVDCKKWLWRRCERSIFLSFLCLVMFTGCFQNKHTGGDERSTTTGNRPFSASQLDQDTDVLPHYLSASLHLFFTAETGNLVSAPFTIKRIRLIDFDGHTEPVYNSKDGISIDGATLRLPQHIVSKTAVFATSYQRIQLLIDRSTSPVKQVEGQQIIESESVYLDGLLPSVKPIWVDVPINEGLGVSLISGSQHQLSIHLASDVSFMKTTVPEAQFYSLEPRLSVHSLSAFPDASRFLNKQLARTDKGFKFVNANQQTDGDKGLLFQTVPEHLSGKVGACLEDHYAAGELSYQGGALHLSQLICSNKAFEWVHHIGKPEDEAFAFHSQELARDKWHFFMRDFPMEAELRLAFGQQGLLGEMNGQPVLVPNSLQLSAKAALKKQHPKQPETWGLTMLGLPYFLSEKWLPYLFLAQGVAGQIRPVPGYNYWVNGFLIEAETAHLQITRLHRQAYKQIDLSVGLLDKRLLIEELTILDESIDFTLNPLLIDDEMDSVITLTADTRIRLSTHQGNLFESRYFTLQKFSEWLENNPTFKEAVMGLRFSQDTEGLAHQELHVIMNSPRRLMQQAALSNKESTETYLVYLPELIAAAAKGEPYCEQLEGEQSKVCQMEEALIKIKEKDYQSGQTRIYKHQAGAQSIRQVYQQLFVGLTQSESAMLLMHLRGNKGLFVPTLLQDTNLQRVKKIMENTGTLFDATNYLVDDLAQEGWVRKMDKDLQHLFIKSQENNPPLIDPVKKVRLRTQ